MQFPLRGLSPCAGKRLVTTRNAWHPGLAIGYHGTLRTSLQAASSPESESGTASSAALSNNNPHVPEHHEKVIDVDAHAIISREVGEPNPTAATADTGGGDWLEPAPGDWGGAVDPKGIKEPDSSGVLFFFIIIAGLSLGIHQLLRYVGAGRGKEQIVQPSSSQVAVVASPASRAKLLPKSSQTSEPGASSEKSPDLSSAISSGVGTRSSAEAREANSAATPSALDDSKAGEVIAASATGKEIEGDEARGPGGPAGASSAQAGASETETGDEVKVDSGSTMKDQSGQFGGRPQQLRQLSPSPSVQPFTVGSTAERASSSGAVESPELASIVENGADAASEVRPAKGPAGNVQMLQGAPGRAVALVPRRVGEASAQDVLAQTATGTASQSLSASTSADGGGSIGGLCGRLSATVDQVVPGPEPNTGAVRSSLELTGSPFAGASAFFMGADGGSRPAAAVAQQAELSAPSRLSLPAVLPEPLSRAPDSTALARLPNDSSLGSLRERAQLSLRAATAAVEASQRAASYAAAASNAASRAAEAAERAAAAATLAQTGLESAAASAIVAAEARIAQAAEAAKDAEERAASAAAHATAYQDMSQSQADIAQRAATVPRPASPGPLSQLQQLWRNASSAFTHANQEDQQQGQRNGSGDELSGTGTAAGNSGVGNGDRYNGGASSGGAPGGSVGAAAAETIGLTVKGLLSWLGQGDGSR